MSQQTLELILKLRDDASANIAAVGSSLRNMAGPAVLSAGATAVGVIGGIGVAAFSMASDVDNATASIQDALGVTREEAELLGDAAVEIFANNWADSIEEAGAALTTVSNQMQLVDPSQLGAVTEQALMLSQTFGEDLDKTTNAANALMSQFGLSSQQAFDFITTGFQQGLNSSGDFLDSIGEYSNQFAEGGATADQFFAQLDNGMQAGVLGTDKAADAFKEFRIRMTEMSDDVVVALSNLGSGSFGADLSEQFGKVGAMTITTVEEAEAVRAKFEEIGLTAPSIEELLTPLQLVDEKTGEMTTTAQDFGSVFMSQVLGGIEEGSLTVADANSIVLGALGEMDNQVHANSIGVELFGTQWEDMGTQAMLAMNDTSTTLEEMTGATDTLGNRSATVSAQFEEAQKKLLVALLPVGEELMAVAVQYMPMVLGAVEDLAPWIEEHLPRAIEWMIGTWEDFNRGVLVVQWAIGQVSDAIGNIIGRFAEFGNAITSVDQYLPDWLRPGSPPPLEIALYGIGAAAESISGGALPTLGRELSAIGTEAAALAEPITLTMEQPSLATLAPLVAEREALSTPLVLAIGAEMPAINSPTLTPIEQVISAEMPVINSPTLAPIEQVISAEMPNITSPNLGNLAPLMDELDLLKAPIAPPFLMPEPPIIAPPAIEPIMLEIIGNADAVRGTISDLISQPIPISMPIAPQGAFDGSAVPSLVNGFGTGGIFFTPPPQASAPAFNPETFAPVSTLGTGGMGGNGASITNNYTVNVYIDGNVTTENELIDSVRRALITIDEQNAGVVL
jgi:phage-related minor tail protein